MPDPMKPVDILLVEDNATDAELCIETLRAQNIANHVAWVRDGEAALDFLFRVAERSDDDADIPKLILLDIGLAKVTGLEVLRAVKSNQRMRTVPIVVLTSSTEDRVIAEAYDLGVNSYISKPVSFEAFAKVIADLGHYWLLVNARKP